MEKGNKSPLFFESSSPLVLTSISVLTGLFAGFYSFPLFLALLLFAILIYSLYQLSKRELKLREIFVWIGVFLVCWIYGIKSAPKVEAFKHKNYYKVLFKVLKVEPYYGRFIKVVAENEKLGRFYFITRRRIFSPGKVCLGSFSPYNLNVYPGYFSPSLKSILFSQGIQAKMYLISKGYTVCKKENGFSFEDIRFKLFKFSERLPDVSKGLFQALVLGVETQLPREYLEKLKKQGLYHQLAISGFNLAVIFGLIYWLCFFILKRTPVVFWGHPLQNICYLIALPGAFFVLMLSGFAPSALRAFVFLFLWGISRLLYRNTTSISVLFLTALVLIFASPHLITSLSFQLSFIATFALLIGDRLFRNILPPDKSRLYRYLLYPVGVSTVVSLAVFPFLIYIGGEFPIATPLNNLIATGFWSFCFIPLSLLTAIIALFSPDLAVFPGELLGKLFNIYSKIPFFEAVFVPKIPANLMIASFVACFLIFLVLYPRLKNKAFIITLLLFIIFYQGAEFLYRKVSFAAVFPLKRKNEILIFSQGKAFCFSRECEKNPKLISNFKKLGITHIKVLNRLNQNPKFLNLAGIWYWEHPSGLTVAFIPAGFRCKNLKTNFLKIPAEVIITEKSFRGFKKLAKDEFKSRIALGRELKDLVYIFPQSSIGLMCRETEKVKNFWQEVFFPLSPYFFGTKGCIEIPFHREVKSGEIRNL